MNNPSGRKYIGKEALESRAIASVSISRLNLMSSKKLLIPYTLYFFLKPVKQAKSWNVGP